MSKELYLGFMLGESTKGELNEGILRAMGGQAVNNLHAAGTEMKGWAEGVNAKVKHAVEVCDDIIEYLEETKKDHPGMDLDMNAFMTWMKTSETFQWRYYFLLDDSTFNGIIADVKAGRHNALEGMTDANMTGRTNAAKQLDRASNLDQLIAIVNKYKSRIEAFHSALKAAGTGAKGFPYQIILIGAAELRSTVKKIVHLAK